MEKQLKERIFGAVVIVSLIVIFVPMLLNPEEDESYILEDSLTIAPNESTQEIALGIPESVLAIQAQTEAIQQQLYADDFVEPEQPSTDQIAQNAPVDDIEALVNRIQDTKMASIVNNKAWVVQLATFADEKNAKNLVKELNSKGFSAYMRETHGQTQDFTRVLVGPEADRQKAERLKATLVTAYKMEGMIIPFVS